MNNITRIPARTLRSDLRALWSTMTGQQMREILTLIWFGVTACILLALIVS